VIHDLEDNTNTAGYAAYQEIFPTPVAEPAAAV
jgi:hypothetical protein